MPQTPNETQTSAPEPRGFGEHTRKTSSEHAHEQGWGLNEDDRRRIPADQQKRGGTDYDYGARDFGDVPSDTSAARRAKPPQSESDSDAGAGRFGAGVDRFGEGADRKRPRKTA